MSITPPIIANAMRKMGWPVASALMQRWVDANQSVMSDAVKAGTVRPNTLPSAQVDESIVTVQWLLKFPQASDAYSAASLRALNANGITLLKTRLAEAGWRSGPFTFGSTSMSARDLDASNQTNIAPVGSTLDTIDDFYGAIGRGLFKTAVVGKVTIDKTKRPIFEVDKVGIYLRDAYDYNGFQALGIWNRDRILSKAESLGVVATTPGKIAGFFGGFEPVFNSTFRDWRASTGRGGDFLIYSDVSWVEPNVKKIPL
jgi:Family of unknown function (DUF6402)